MKRELDRMLDEIFNATDDTLQQMATKANLCYQTILRLDKRETRFPRFSTVWKLAKAYGFTLEIRRLHKQRKAG